MSVPTDTLGDGPDQLIVSPYQSLVVPSCVNQGWTGNVSPRLGAITTHVLL